MAQQIINNGTTQGDGTGESPFTGMAKVNANFTELYTAKDAQAAALALKAPLNNPTFTGTVNGISKAMVGLGNVDNTPDASKPVSSAQGTAIAAGDAQRLKVSDVYADFVTSGLVTPTDTDLTVTMTAGIAYVNGKRVVKTTGDADLTFTYLATRDTYVDVDENGVVSRTAVTNGAATPSLAAGSLRLEKVVTDATKVASVTRFDCDRFLVSARKDTNGAPNLTWPSGQRITKLNDYPSASTLEVLPTNDVTMWNTDKTAALTVAVDTTVLFDGRPTLKITIPAGTSGTCKVGTIVANALIPYGWDKKDLALALMHSGFTGYDWSTTFPPVPVMYLGDSGYTHFWTSGASLGTYPEIKPRADEWFVAKPPATWGTGGGTPDTNLMTGGVINQTALRCKLQWTQVSQATDCYIWIGLFGKMPPRPKATLVWCLDDGYAEWDTFIKPLFKHYDMPVSLGIARDVLGGANYLTATQVTALFNDPSRLFDIVNHATDNTAYNALGAAAYYAQVEANRAFLQSIGITGDGPSHHPIVQSQWGNDWLDLMQAGGFLTARSSVMNATMHGRDQLIRSGQDKLRWILGADAFLGSATSLATVKGLMDTAVTQKDFFMIGGHEFKDSGGVAAYTWTRSDMEQLVGYARAQVDAGTMEVKSWSRWYADLTGRSCDRR